MHLFFYLLDFELYIKMRNLKNRTESLIMSDMADTSFSSETAKIFLFHTMILCSLFVN